MRKIQFIDRYVKWIKLRRERSEWTNTNENIISNKRKVKASLCVISHRCWATPVQWASAGSRGAKARFPAELCRGAGLRTASLSTSAGSLWTAWCLSARYGKRLSREYWFERSLDLISLTKRFGLFSMGVQSARILIRGTKRFFSLFLSTIFIKSSFYFWQQLLCCFGGYCFMIKLLFSLLLSRVFAKGVLILFPQ